MPLPRALLLSLSLLAATPAFADWDARSYDGDALRFHVYRPAEAPRAIAVVLHGCTQTARGYATHAGWTEMAEMHRLILLAPEFQDIHRKNCFNWMGDKDWPSRSRMVASIRGAVDQVARGEGVDKVFFTGLSAGGAMSAVLLAESAKWDGVTVLGAGIVAGVVYGCTDVIDPIIQGPPGLDDAAAGSVCMGDSTNPLTANSWNWLEARFPEMVKRLGNHRKRPLTVSLWHGSADPRVDPINGVHGSDQWSAALGLKTPTIPRLKKDGTALPQETARRYEYENSRKGPAKVEMFLLRGMAHKVPINTSGPGVRCGSQPSPGTGDDHYDDAGICSAHWIAKAMLER